MIRFLIKILITALVVAGVSELGKRSGFIAALLASLPLTSLLAFIWMYLDTKDAVAVAGLSMDIFWLVIPSLLFFPVFSYLLRHEVQFGISLIVSAVLTTGFYFLFFFLLKKSGM